MNKSYEEAVKKGVKVRSIIVINPGNPTGAIFSRSSIEALFKFAHSKGLVVLADEVYQENIYSEKKKFLSFRKVLADMPADISKSVELISFHSCSKGFLGECGIRGGYAEMHNIDPDVMGIVRKQKSIYMGANTVGQIMMDLKVRPPNLDECNKKTVDQYENEVSGLLTELKSKANLLEKELKNMIGMHTNPIEGAMYGFPRVDLPKKFVEEAKSMGRTPDTHYCFLGSLLSRKLFKKLELLWCLVQVSNREMALTTSELRYFHRQSLSLIRTLRSLRHSMITL